MTDIESLLKSSGLKSTKQRKAIFEIIYERDIPATAEDVYFQLKNSDVSANLSTVYRTLETMSDCGLIKKLGIVGETKAFYEIFGVVHRHFLVCIGCKKILPIPGCPLKEYEKSLEEQTGYEISGHRLDIYGYCPECKKAKK